MSMLRGQLEESQKRSSSWESRARDALGALEIAVKKAGELEKELKRTRDELDRERKKADEERSKLLERVRRAVEGAI